MFTKLKNKIAEEVKQSPLKISASVQQLTQAVVSSSSSSVVVPTSNDDFSIGDESEETPQNSPSKSGEFQSVDLHGEAPLSPPVASAGGRSRRSSTSSITSEASSLFPIFESPVLNSFSLQSDLESASELEDSLGHQLERISKEQLYTSYRKVQARYTKYKGRYADLARHYRELDRENVKAKTILVESQDKALRRIAELKEQCQLEQKAKAHLEDALRNDLEEKDHLISTLHTKIELLKLNGGKEEDDSSTQEGSSSENLLIDLSGGEPTVPVTKRELQEEVASSNEAESVLKEKIQKLESLLSKCKESIRCNKGRVTQLSLENQQLQQTLAETKESSSTQVSRLTEDLLTAQQEIGSLEEALDMLRKREEDAALSLAENKMTIHRELEAKEEQIRCLRDSLTQITHDKEALVERATILQNEVTRLKSVAAAPSTDDTGNSEDDRQNLIQELSRGKAEAVKLLQQDMQQKLIHLGTKMSEKLQSSELTNKQLEAEVMALKHQIEEQVETNKRLELKLKSMQDKGSSAEKTHVDSEGSFELEVALKEFENKLQAAELKLAEKENLIAELEANSERLTTEHNKKLMSLQAEVEIALADRLQAECELSERKQEFEEGQKVLAEVQSQLDLELSKKIEAKNKHMALLNQVDNVYVTVKDKDAEVTSSEIVSLKEKVQNLEIKLSEAVEECIKIRREKENLSSGLVGSLKAASQIKQSLQALRTNVYDRLNHAKEDVNRLGFQMMDLFELMKTELETVRRDLQEKDDIHTNLRANVSVLEKQLSEQKANSKCESDLEEMLEHLKLSKKNLETELSENNTLIRKLQHELQNMTKTLEKKEQEISKLQDSVTDLQREITQKMEKAGEDLIILRNDYKIKLQSKDTEISELMNKHNECCRKIICLESEVSTAESNMEKVSDNYKNLKLENEKLDNKVKELEDCCHSLKTECVVLTEERTGLAGTVEELTHVLTGHRRENDVLNEKVQMLTDSLSDSNNETTELRVQTEKLSNELMKASGEKQVLERQIEEIKEARLKIIENFKLQEEVWNNTSKSDKAEIMKLETTLQALQKELMNAKQQLELETSNLSSHLKQSQQREEELFAEAEMLKEENFKAKEDQLNLKCELDQSQQRVQLLSAQIENVNKENADQEQLLKQKQAELEIMVADKETILAKFTTESTKVLETEAKLITLHEGREKCLEELALLKAKEEDMKQSNIELEEQLNVEAQRTNFLEDECKRMKESNDLLTEQFEQLNSVVDGLKKTNEENYELIEHLKAEKTALESTINNCVTQEKEINDEIQNLQSEVLHLKLQNESHTSEGEIKTQEIKELKKEFQQSMFERSVVEETKLDLEKQLGNLMKEKRCLEEQLSEANSKKEKEEDERLQIEKLYANNKDLQKELDTVLKEKLVLEQTLTTALGNLKGLQAGEVREQLEENLLEKTDLKHRFSADVVEKLREIQNLEKLLVEKGQLEHQLDNTLVDLQVKEKQLTELEETHTQKIKQLVQDFEKRLAQKDEELTNIENKMFERAEQEENIQFKELQDHIKQLREAYEAQGEAYQQLYLQHEDSVKMKDTDLSNCEHRIQELKAAHQQELAEVDKRWHQSLEQRLAEAEARFKGELTELSKEWRWERKPHVSDTETTQHKELENTSQLAVAAVESGTGSIELLHRQLVAQANELKEAKRLHRLEVNELRQLLSLRRTSNTSGRTNGNPTVEDACTELEYLRNILYEYMMGKEPVVLARVIAAVVKFDTEQTSRVLQKEEQKQTLLGQLGIV